MMANIKHLLIGASIAAMLGAAPVLAQSTYTTTPEPTTERAGPDDKAGNGMTNDRSDSASPARDQSGADPAASTPDRAGSGMAQSTVDMTGWRASQLIGASVRNDANEAIGDINDFILGANGNIEQVIIGVGGFLGMGERNVAMQMSELNISRQDDTLRVTTPKTKADLKSMPKWDRNSAN